MIIGLDFGTTTSCISYYKNGHCRVIPNDQGQYTTPTTITVNKDDTFLFGFVKNNPITNIKRLLGITYSEFLNNKSLVSFFEHRGLEITKDSNSPYCAINSHSVTHLTQKYLQYLLEIAKLHIGENITGVVITVPVYFTDNQREILKSCCPSILRIINEPTAAALVYSLGTKGTKGTETVLVLDCGGGTTDISIIDMDYEEQIYEVRRVKGDNYLGGEDLSVELLKWCMPKLKGITFSDCERAKCQLSYSQNVTIFNEITGKSIIVTQGQFIQLGLPYFNRIITMLKEVSFGISVSKIIFIGGTTRIPFIKNLCKNVFGTSIPICNTIDPDQTVSIGAALQGHFLQKNEEDVNNDSPLLIDIIPTTLGVETEGGLMTPIITKMTPIPVSRSQIFTTTEDYVSEMEISIYQGDRKFVEWNQLITKLTLTGLDKTAKRGEIHIKISFDIDADGILSITAIDQKTNSKCQLKVDKTLLNVDSNDDTMDHLFEDTLRSNKLMAKKELEKLYLIAKKGFEEQKHKFNSNNTSQINELFTKCKKIIDGEYLNLQPNEIKQVTDHFRTNWHDTMLKLIPD